MIVLVTAYNEAERLASTLRALRDAFGSSTRIIVADDHSTDGTYQIALDECAELVRAPRNIGKGGVATLAAERILPMVEQPSEGPVTVVICDGDLADTARQLPSLVEAVEKGECDLAVATFHRREGGGFGFAVNYARAAIRRRVGLELTAPISGQRAMRMDVLVAALPFAPRFGMEIGMTVDVARAGFEVAEVHLDMEHRATGRDLRGFLHRGRQLRDFVLVEWSRR